VLTIIVDARLFVRERLAKLFSSNAVQDRGQDVRRATILVAERSTRDDVALVERPRKHTLQSACSTRDAVRRKRSVKRAERCLALQIDYDVLD
jgi:hypothetical protein